MIFLLTIYCIKIILSNTVISINSSELLQNLSKPQHLTVQYTSDDLSKTWSLDFKLSIKWRVLLRGGEQKFKVIMQRAAIKEHIATRDLRNPMSPEAEQGISPLLEELEASRVENAAYISDKTSFENRS